MTYRVGPFRHDIEEVPSEVACPVGHQDGWSCTRTDGHAGLHYAGVGGGNHIAEWDDDDYGSIPNSWLRVP